MKKNTQNEKLIEAQNKLLEKFIEFKRNSAQNSFEKYRQVINALTILARDSKNNKIRNFWALIPKCFSKKEDETKNKLLESLESENKNKWPKSKKSYKTYINQFIKFCRETENIDLEYALKYDAADQAALNDEDGEIYLHNTLFTKFKSRLRSQDRTSGDKIWLPLRFIAKLYSLEKKENKQKENRFSSWLDNLTSNIYVHYMDNNKINSIRINDDKFSALKFKYNNDGTFCVYVRLQEKETYNDFPVYTPTGKGNLKEQMIVKDISEIDIDHVKPIDQTLREKEQDLKVLEEVSCFYKELQAQDEPDENKGVRELFEKLKEGDKLTKLKDELDSISEDGVLRLMDSKCNSKKSNGSTFQKILKAEDNYYGILEEDQEIIGENDNKYYYYYQNLNTSKFHVSKDKPKGEVIENISEIIDFI